MQAANRVVYNTGILYIKLIFGVILGLFTTRLVLDSLGEINYGIYALVAGVVGMLGILNSSMSIASMRFMAHSLGTGDQTNSLKTFNTVLLLHFIIGIGVIFFMELGGFLMFKYFLNIPDSYLFDAKVVFHFMVLTSFITIISVPYDAVMNSHENILILSLVDLLGYIIQLGIAVYLNYCSANLLIIYGLLMFLTQVLLRIIKQWYSKFKYDECKIIFRNYVDKQLIKTVLSFTGWNLFGSLAAISVTQVRGLLLNMFFGVNINAADGISKTASSQVNMISASMTRALNPQLVKSEGSGNRKRMLHMTELATKFSVYLFALFAIPVIFEASYLLHLWLKVVPPFAIIFCQLILISLFLDKFTFEITSAIRAVGNIKSFQIAETIIIVLNIPLSYIIFKMGYPPFSIFVINIFITLLVFIERLYFGKALAELDNIKFLKNGVLSVLIPVTIAILLTFIPIYFLKESFFRLCITSTCSIVILTLSMWYIGLNINEKAKLKKITISISQRIYDK